MAGFGEAGARIIAKSVSETGELNLMHSGFKINAIFGYCDVKPFFDAIRVLRADVTLLVCG